MSFGEVLRNAREAKGYSCSQIASQTRILVQIVEEMENEDFHRIAAAIYGRGFVKLIAEALDLDPQPLVHEFMEIYEGRRAPTVRTRTVPLAPEPPPMPEPELAPEPTPEPMPEPTPEPAPEPIPEPIPAPIPELPPEPVPETVREPEPLLPAYGPDTLSEPETVPPPVANPFAEPIQEPVAGPAPESIPTPVPEPVVEPEAPSALDKMELFSTPPPPVMPEKVPSPFAGTPTAPSLFDPPIEASEPAPQPVYGESPYLPPTYEVESGPSAGERFRNGLSVVSHGVLTRVQSIPRSTWRIALLAVGALVVIGLLVWGCAKLYSVTSETPEPTEKTEVAKPASVPEKEKPATPAKKPAAAKAQPAAPAPSKPQPKPQPKTLSTSGIKVPALYID